MKSISEIKNEFMQADEQALEELYEKYAEDTRKWGHRLDCNI